MTVTRAARAYGIPAREPGITSHPHLVTPADDELPPDVRRATEGQLHGWLRLRRFQQAMNHPSLNQAAHHEGVHIATLVTQIHRLERDIGAQLIHRGSPTTPSTPTDRGAALLHDLQQPHIQALIDAHGRPVRGWKPDDPRRNTMRTGVAGHVGPAARVSRPAAANTPAAVIRPAQRRRLPDDIPGDLRRAVDGQRNGWARLQRFATAMTYPTLTDAADALGISIATLIEQLHRLEHDVGAPLFHRATPASRYTASDPSRNRPPPAPRPTEHPSPPPPRSRACHR